MKKTAILKSDGRAGSALILVLWIIGMLSLIVISFAFDAHLEGKVVSYSRKKAKVEAFATSGIELAKSYLDRSYQITGNETDEEKEKDPRYDDVNDLRCGKTVTVGYVFRKETENEDAEGDEIGTVTVTISPENSLRNINKLTEEDWERILGLIGVPEDDWPELIDSFYDWTDSDDEARTDGAETTDYYAELDPPYSAANGPLKTIRELLFIKGFSEPLLSGGILNPEDAAESQIVISNGLERLLTTYGDGLVNINALPTNQLGLAILQTLPGVEDDVTAGAILEERENSLNYTGDEEDAPRAFTDNADARNRLSDYTDDASFYEQVTTMSQIFRITSVGQIDRVTKKIEATVFFDGDLFRILEWHEEP